MRVIIRVSKEVTALTGDNERNKMKNFKINGHIITSYDYFSNNYRFFNAENKIVCTIEDENENRCFDDLVNLYGDL